MTEINQNEPEQEEINLTSFELSILIAIDGVDAFKEYVENVKNIPLD